MEFQVVPKGTHRGVVLSGLKRLIEGDARSGFESVDVKAVKDVVGRIRPADARFAPPSQVRHTEATAATLRTILSPETRVNRGTINWIGPEDQRYRPYLGPNRASSSTGMNVLELANGAIARFHLFGPVVLDCDGQAVEDYGTPFVDYLQYYDWDILGERTKWARIEGTALVLIHRIDDVNYSHVLCDSIPRLMAIAEDPDAYVVIEKGGPAWHFDVLNAYGISPNRIVELDHFQGVRADRLVVPDNLSVLQHPVLKCNPSAIAWLRSKVLTQPAPHPAPVAVDGSREIVLVVGRVRDRRILNSDQLVERLSKDFSVIYVELEKVPFAEQVRLFAEASVVIGVHGAGLSNVLFMQPGKILIEIAHPNLLTVAFYMMASEVGVRYFAVTDATVNSRPLRPKQQDITLSGASIEGIAAAIKAALVNPAEPMSAGRSPHQDGFDPARDIRQEIIQLFQTLLRRAPKDDELGTWLNRASDLRLSFRDIFNEISATWEFRARNRVTPGHAPGHYYSPIPDPDELRKHLRVDRTAPLESLGAIKLNDDALQAEFDLIRPHLRDLDFPAQQIAGRRYYTANPMYWDGDATILAGLISRHKPRKIVEIGSGFSTACMLDTIDLRGLTTEVTCIEPHPQRLKELLRPEDVGRITLIEKGVQHVPVDLFSELQRGDIVFIDSSHVLKTGSDVCFQLFEILPKLAPGVLVHFHDIQHPFEYIDSWIFRSRFAWNEIYALRAFLMYNDAFRIIAYNHYFQPRHRTEIEAAYGKPLTQVGYSMWLMVEPAG